MLPQILFIDFFKHTKKLIIVFTVVVILAFSVPAVWVVREDPVLAGDEDIVIDTREKSIAVTAIDFSWLVRPAWVYEEDDSKMKQGDRFNHVTLLLTYRYPLC